MILLLLVFGACYAKAYWMHRKGKQIRSKAAERAASGLPCQVRWKTRTYARRQPIRVSADEAV